MKKISFCAFALFGLLASVSAQAVIQGTVNAETPVQTTATANINLEAPFRCFVKEYGDIDVMTTISLKKGDFELTQTNAKDLLPRYEVNGFSFPTMPIDEAIQLLVQEAGITVYAEDGDHARLDAQDLYGELEPVLQALAEAGDVFYRYDAASKKMYISRHGEFVMQLPANRMIMLSVLDAIRGAGIDTVEPDWNKSTIRMTLTRAEQEKINKLMSYIVRDGKILLADTQVYELTPQMQAEWQDVVNRFGAGRIHTMTDGLVGKMMTMGHKDRTNSFISKLPPSFADALISEGVAIVPHGWKMRFDVGRCAKFAANDLSVVLSTNIQNPQDVATAVSLKNATGELTTFNATAGIDDTLAIVGIPASVAGLSGNNELLVTLKLRFIRLISEGK